MPFSSQHHSITEKPVVAFTLCDELVLQQIHTAHQALDRIYHKAVERNPVSKLTVDYLIQKANHHPSTNQAARSCAPRTKESVVLGPRRVQSPESRDVKTFIHVEPSFSHSPVGLLDPSKRPPPKLSHHWSVSSMVGL
ncbi:hypothetical protein VDGL01_01997 [Verticillium dahliae]